LAFKDPEKKKAYDREYQRARKQEKQEKAASKAPFCYVTSKGKAVRSDVMDNYAIKGDEGSRQMPLDKFASLYATDRVIQPLYNPEALAAVLEMNACHARCCSVKARDTAGLGYSLEPTVENPAEGQKETLREFLEAQEGLTTMFYRQQYDVEAIGYGAIEVVREQHRADGVPVKMVQVPAHTLRMHSSGNKVVQRRGNKKTWFKVFGKELDVDHYTGHEHDFGSLQPERRATEIIWNNLYSQRSDYYGIPDIVPALGAVHGDISRRDFNLNFFDNFGVPAYAVFITGDYDPGPVNPDTGRTELEEQIEEHFSALADKPHSTMVLTVPTREGGAGDVQIKFQPLSVDVKDASFRLYRKDNRDEVIVAHGVPPYRIGVAEEGSLGGNTAKESTEIYKDSVIKPRQEVLEEVINKHVVRDGLQITDWRFSFAEIDTQDEAHDLEMVKALFDMGAMRIRDVIQRYGEKYGIEDDPDDPLLDARFVQGQPLTPETLEGQEQAAGVMRSLKNELLKEAVDNGRSSYGLEGGDVFADQGKPRKA